jgi:hypothetical protein
MLRQPKTVSLCLIKMVRFETRQRSVDYTVPGVADAPAGRNFTAADAELYLNAL